MSAVKGRAVIDARALRADFPILGTKFGDKPLVYLDNAATSQKPRAVIEAMDEFYFGANSNVHRGVHRLSALATQLFDATREKVRGFVGAESANEIVFTKGCTEGINLVAQAFARPRLRAGDEILVSTMEHHSNIVPWQLVAEQTGAKVRAIPIDDAGEIDLAAYESMLSERTRIVAIVHVSNSLGTINPIAEMAESAHRVGATIVVDGAQAGPHLRVNVGALDADFYTLSCHKMYAPTGIGVLYGKSHMLESMPPYHGGGDMIRTVSFEGSTYAEPPSRFEAGTPNVAGVIGLGAAIDYLASLGGGDLDAAMAAIEAYERELTAYGMAALAEIDGLRLTGTAPRKAGILAFVLDGIHAHDVGTILDSDGIAIRAGHHCCMPLMRRLGVPATARASLAFYNLREEIEALVHSIRKVKETFK